MSTTKARFQTADTPGCSNCTVDTMWPKVARTPLTDCDGVVLASGGGVVAPACWASEGTAAALVSKDSASPVGLVAAFPTSASTKHTAH